VVCAKISFTAKRGSFLIKLMVLERETGEKVQGKLLHELMIREGILRISEREGERYVFEWEKKWEKGRKPPRPRIVEAIIGKILCNLPNETGDIARRIYETRQELKDAKLGKRYRIKKRMKIIGKELLPHLTSEEDLEFKIEFKKPDDVTKMVNTYWGSQNIEFSVFRTKEEEILLNSLGEF